MARHGHHTAWHDEEEAESAKHSLHQKEAITAQMIGIISSRLDALQALANDRKLGLECDLKVNSDYSSKMVPALQDPYESRASAGNRAKTVSSTMLASNQAMMERLFGPDEKSRLRTQVLKKNKADLQKSENRRNARVHLEKQLQASIEGHITRTVDNFYYYAGATSAGNGGSGAGGGNSESGSPTSTGPAPAPHMANGSLQPTSNITVNAKLLLLHTCERMRITHGKKNFKRFLLSEVSCTLFDDIFWLVFCHFFQRNSSRQQRELVDSVGTRYVKILTSSRSNSDYIFRVFPYAIASGICWGFHYLFPGSRHLYTTEFKNGVFLFVGELLLGLKLCPVSVLSMRRQFFPDEMQDETSLKTKNQQTAAAAAASAPATAESPSVMPDLSMLLPRLNGSQSAASLAIGATASKPLHKSSSESYLAKQLGSENNLDKILAPPVLGAGAAAGADDAPRQLRTHQLRTFFNAAQLSPLMKEYLGAQTKSVKKPCYLLRTTPFPDCPVGGEDTYHKYYQRKGQKNYAAAAQREQDKFLKDIQKVQHDTRRELSVLHETRDIVLSSGKKALQAYCTLLLSKKTPAEEGEDAAAANSGGGNASGKGGNS